MYSHQRTPVKSTQAVLGVGWYYQHPKDFLRPYGVESTGFSQETLRSKIRAINHSMLNKPHVGLSILSDTILSNLEIFKNIQQVADQFPRFQKRVKKDRECIKDTE